MVTLALSGMVSAGPLGNWIDCHTRNDCGLGYRYSSGGVGLPPESGICLAEGEPLYEAKCASYGLFGGEGRWPVLAGGEGTLDTLHPEKTVGSYWPFASTLWDYIYRAMPYTAPQSLSKEEVYSIAAYVLYLNDIVEEDFCIQQETFTQVKMPNEAKFLSITDLMCRMGVVFRAVLTHRQPIVTTINGVTTGRLKEDSGLLTNHYEGNPSAAMTLKYV